MHKKRREMPGFVRAPCSEIAIPSNKQENKKVHGKAVIERERK